MAVTQRHLLKPEDLEGATKALSIYGIPVDGYVGALYTRQPDAEWKYCVGRCVLGQDAGDDRMEIYPAFAFVSRRFEGTAFENVVKSLASEAGIEVAAGLPPLRLTAAAPNWREEIVPGHATATGMPARRFRVVIEANPVFANDQLIDYDLPYRDSAERYVRTFLGLTPREAVDRGELTIDVPEQRGAIRLSGGRLSIVRSTVPLRLVGEIDGTPFDLRNDGVAEIDDKNIRSAELWLLAKGSELVDYISTTHWPYKFQAPPQEAEQEQKLLELIRSGESETCEFKPYVDLSSQKASEIEKTVCAFSNQRGGTLFIGVNNEGDIVGLAKELLRRGRRTGLRQDLDTLTTEYQKEVCVRLRESLKDNQCFTSHVTTLSGTQIVVVKVQQSRDVNFFVTSDLAQTAYTRHGATNTKMSPPEIKAKGSSDDAQAILRHAVFSP